MKNTTRPLILIKRLICIMMIMMIAAGCTETAHADTASKKIRVGFFAFDGYHNVDEEGQRSGYGYEFIQKILRYNDYTAVYVGYEKSWSDMQGMLSTGSIDVLTSAQKTPEREEKFDFSEPIGTSAAILTVKAGNDEIVAGEYDSYQGIRVGVIEGNSRNDRFEEFAKEKGFEYTLVYYEDMQKMQNDLQLGKNIDAIVTSNLRSLGNEWILDKFAVAPFYAMVKKGNTELLDQINYAIEQMNTDSVGWQNELFDKYYSESSDEMIALSSTEREYLSELISEGKKITVLVHPDRAPYCYIQDGKAAGILPDIFEKIAGKLELPYEYVLCDTRAEYSKKRQNGDADIVLEARNNLSEFENMGYKLTDPYMNISYAALERTEFSGEPRTVATIKDAYTSDKNIRKLLEQKKVLYYDNLSDCVEAVNSKEAEVCYLYDYSGQKYAIENIRGNLQSTTIPELKDELTFAVRATDDYRLLAVMNKGVTSVKTGYVDTAVKQNTDFSLGKLTLTEFLARNPMVLAVILILMAIIVSLIIYVDQKRKNEFHMNEKNNELERFIGYVCKANTSVTELNFTTGSSMEYVIVHDRVEVHESSQFYMNPDKIFDNVSPEDDARVQKVINTENLRNMIDESKDAYIECRLKEHGVYRWYALTLSAIPRSEAHPNNILIFKHDIDESKKKEEESRQSLEDALDAANQASMSKGNFLSNMSHEIRTPLNAIIGYLTLAKDKDTTPDRLAHCLNNCDMASKHLLQIINDVLDMSSIESGKLKIAHEDFDMKKEITDITAIFFQNAKLKGVEFETRVYELTQEWVNGDQLRLNQILMNLLSNAVKFTPEHGLITLSVHQVREDDKKIYFTFKVSDSGIGMSEEYMKRIFHPFEQENAGTAKKFGGSGLGLSITNNLVHMMGGTITVESTQNVGTTFTVTMFFDKCEQKHLVEKTGQNDFSHVRVLVVDDKEDECTYVKTMLKRCGVKSDTVNSGEAALRKIKSRMGGDYSYDLCIIDWNMPKMDGCEVTRKIRREIGIDVPVIIATAYDISEFEEEAKEAGVNKIISKPLFQSTLFDLLINTFGGYDPAAQGTACAAQIDMSGVHILLAEDNAMNMEIAVTMLEKTGIHVEQAVNGKEAVEKFTACEKGTFDLILMDVQMPVMDGYTATREIRKSSHPEAADIPIIAMTANAFAEDVTEALANGMNAHIAKPINYDKLFEILEKFAKKS